jgi:putative nucleotidyltransferase with HDIG domain
MFGYHSKVDSISMALTIIGTQQLRDLALASSVIKIFRGIPENLMTMASFWQHSIACGIVARSLASYLRESNVERFFVAGILHDVGQLVMCTTIPETVREIVELSRESDQLYYIAERNRLGFDHAEVGAALFRAWKIPASIQEPVACHHAPRQAKLFPLETAVIHLADIFCQAMEFGQSGEWCVSALDEEAWERLDMSVSMVGTILKQAEPQIEEVYAILGEDL